MKEQQSGPTVCFCGLYEMLDLAFCVFWTLELSGIGANPLLHKMLELSSLTDEGDAVVVCLAHLLHKIGYPAN